MFLGNSKALNTSQYYALKYDILGTVLLLYIPNSPTQKYFTNDILESKCRTEKKHMPGKVKRKT